MQNLILSLLSFCFFTPLAYAEFTNSKCDYALEANDVIQVNRQWKQSDGRCFISVHPRRVSNLEYRDFYFDNTGLFMVFNSYGPGSVSTTTGARVFFLFPQVLDYPDFSFEENGDVIIKTVSGHQFRVSGKDFSLISLSDGTVKEKPLSPKNNGGVEISLKKGFWLDAGFKMGGTRLDNPSSKSHFLSPHSSEKCALVHKTFLNYVSSDGDFEMKYTGAAMTQFVKTKCPQLKL